MVIILQYVNKRKQKKTYDDADYTETYSCLIRPPYWAHEVFYVESTSFTLIQRRNNVSVSQRREPCGIVLYIIRIH